MRPTFTPKNAGFEARTRQSFSKQPMMATLGASLGEVGPGWAEISLPYNKTFTQQHGFMHAGVLATVLDNACGYAAFSLMPEDAAVLTTEFKIHLLRPAQGKVFHTIAWVIKPGRTLTVAQSVLTADDSQDPIAMVTATLMALVDTDIEG